LLERLSNRLGEQRVRGLRCIADHRPERAWQLCRPGETDDRRAGPGRAALSQPPWLLANPRPLRVCKGMPEYGGALHLEALPERIEAGWWDGFDITRDYFVAHSPAGERLWVFRDRRGGGWYLHGLFQ
jgi:protein ImuB